MAKLLSSKQPGVAMLLALLVAGAIGVVLFAVSRLTITEVLSSREIREGSLAYYAAEGGIEKGLLEYRQNHDIIKNNIVSNNLSSGAKSIADIGYLGMASGELVKDSKVEITIANPGETLTITFTNSPTTTKSKIEYQRLDQVGSMWLTTARGLEPLTGRGTAITKSINTLQTSKKIVLRVFSEAPNSKVNYVITTTHLRGADSGISTINSTGTFGQTSRKLKATIDRRQNQLIGIFDFTIYSSEDLRP